MSKCFVGVLSSHGQRAREMRFKSPFTAPVNHERFDIGLIVNTQLCFFD